MYVKDPEHVSSAEVEAQAISFYGAEILSTISRCSLFKSTAVQSFGVDKYLKLSNVLLRFYDLDLNCPCVGPMLSIPEPIYCSQVSLLYTTRSRNS